MLKPESRQAGAFHSQSNLNEETKQINETAVQHAAFFFFFSNFSPDERSLKLCHDKKR